MTSARPAPRFFLLLVALTTALLVLVLRPIFAELLMAAVLAGVLWPVERWLTARLRGRRSVAAGLLTAAVALTLAGPVAALAAYAIRDGSDGIRFVAEALQSDAVADVVARLPAPARDALTDAFAHVPKDLSEVMAQARPGDGRAAAAAVGTALIATGSVLMHIGFMLIALFFLLDHGRGLVDWIDRVSPLGPGQTHELLRHVKRVSYAVLVSTIITGGVQTVAALVGYLIARVPNPVFFAMVTFFVSFVPAIGAASVCLVAAALQLITGHPFMAAFLALWGVIVVGLVDNVVKPWLMQGGTELHGAVVFFALVGGLAAFGAIGLLVGPLVVSLFLVLLGMYQRDYSDAPRPE
jgi:predicted PurR-regulated permease PerM